MRPREQPARVPPAVYADPSVAARQAVGLLTFRRWRRVVGLDCGSLETLEEHLWQRATVEPTTFDAWYRAHPLVTFDDDMPDDLRRAVAVSGVDQDEAEAAIDALVEITYGGLFTGLVSETSLESLDALGRVTTRHGVPLADPAPFTGSLWVDDAWGRPDAATLRRWRDVVWR
ncbi:hypothetical protein GCM10023113_02100 [Cellulomonas oligotrophica]|nr:hypothetical protein Col01nite_18920 [Cellulomonas oligotrophica]